MTQAGSYLRSLALTSKHCGLNHLLWTTRKHCSQTQGTNVQLHKKVENRSMTRTRVSISTWNQMWNLNWSMADHTSNNESTYKTGGLSATNTIHMTHIGSSLRLLVFTSIHCGQNHLYCVSREPVHQFWKAFHHLAASKSGLIQLPSMISALSSVRCKLSELSLANGVFHRHDNRSHHHNRTKSHWGCHKNHSDGRDQERRLLHLPWRQGSQEHQNLQMSKPLPPDTDPWSLSTRVLGPLGLGCGRRLMQGHVFFSVKHR